MFSNRSLRSIERCNSYGAHIRIIRSSKEALEEMDPNLAHKTSSEAPSSQPSKH